VAAEPFRLHGWQARFLRSWSASSGAERPIGISPRQLGASFRCSDVVRITPSARGCGAPATTARFCFRHNFLDSSGGPLRFANPVPLPVADSRSSSSGPAVVGDALKVRPEFVVCKLKVRSDRNFYDSSTRSSTRCKGFSTITKHGPSVNHQPRYLASL